MRVSLKEGSKYKLYTSLVFYRATTVLFFLFVIEKKPINMEGKKHIMTKIRSFSFSLVFNLHLIQVSSN